MLRNSTHMLPKSARHLASQKRKSYFDDVNRDDTLHAHFDGEKPLRFMIIKDIVDVMIGEMLFDPD
jgi:hypothetical protein